METTAAGADQSEEALHRAYDDLESVFQALPDLYFRLDADGVILDYRAGDASRLYAPPDTFLGRRMPDVLPPDVGCRFQEAIRQVAQTGAAECIEYALPLPGGPMDFEARLVRLRGERPDPILVIVRDITERKHSERALRQSEEHFRLLIENTSDIITIVDTEGVIRYKNPAAERTHGHPEEEALGKNVFSFIHPDDVEGTVAVLQQVQASPGRPFTAEYRYRHRDGSWRHFESVGRTLSPTSADEGVIVNARDITERKRAEEALQQSEERFRLLTENTSDIIAIIDPGGTVQYLNPSAVRVLGYPTDQIVGTNAFALVHPEDIAALQGELSHVVENPGVARRAEFRARHRDNSWRVLEGVGRTLPPDSPYRGAVVINLRDITERKRAEEALQQSEEHFRLLIENASDTITIIDAEGVICYQSPAVERLFGYGIEEMIGHKVFEFFHPDDIAGSMAELARTAAQPGVTHSSEFRFRHKDGHYVFCEAAGRTILPDSAAAGMIASTRDITERKRAEAALRDSEARLRFALEAGEMGAWEWDLNGRVGWSPMLERIHGMAPGSFRGTLAEVMADVHSEDRDKLAAMIRNPMAAGGELEIEFRIVRRDGSVRWLAAKGRVIHDEHGRPLRMAGVCMDITARREAEIALRQATEEAERAREEAEAANRAKSEFLSRMSHELRTPMNSILGFAQLLERKSPTPEQRRSIDYILKAGRHLLELINEVLDIARIEADRLPLALEPVPVGAILQEALTLVQPLASPRGCWIESDAALRSDRCVLADRQRLTQVLLNLFSNAVKYNRPRGRVGVSCDEDGDRLWIRVRDTGAGIAPEKMARLFVPFERLGAEQSDVEGTGLGLALSRRLVEAMGGVLTAESAPGRGSTFSVGLARAGSAGEPRESGSPDAACRQRIEAEKTATLLCIEDDPANLSLIENILAERAEITLISALQGRLGLDLASEHRPDLILLDLNLPDIDGDEVLRRLRGEPRTQHIPVVVVSADATPARVDRLMQAGARDYLTKPLDVEQFLRTIDAVLEEGG